MKDYDPNSEELQQLREYTEPSSPSTEGSNALKDLDEASAIGQIYYNQWPDAAAAADFAYKVIQVWNSGAMNGIYQTVYKCAEQMLVIIQRDRKAKICAENLRMIAGYKPKFSSNIRAKL